MSNNFVISLKTATERRNHTQTVFDKAKVDFSFFDAIAPAVDFLKPFELKLDTNATLLSGNELACFLSHFSLWEYAVKKNLDYITIFEDDVFFWEKSLIFILTPTVGFLLIVT